MTQLPVRFYDSLAVQLLRVIFGLYLMVAIFVTVVQLTLEYYHEKDNITQELRELSTIFGPGISNSFWTLDHSNLQSIILGMEKLSLVIGVQVKDHQGKEVFSVGNILDNAGKLVVIEQSGTSLGGTPLGGIPPDENRSSLYNTIVV